MTEIDRKRRGRPKLDENSPKLCPRCEQVLLRHEFKGQGYCPACMLLYKQERTNKKRDELPVTMDGLLRFKAIEERVKAFEVARNLFSGHMLPQTRCDCCYVWMDTAEELSDTESGHKICDLCGFTASRCGSCPEHGSPHVFFPTAVGGSFEPVPNEIRERCTPKKVKLPMTNEEAIHSAAK